MMILSVHVLTIFKETKEHIVFSVADRRNNTERDRTPCIYKLTVSIRKKLTQKRMQVLSELGPHYEFTEKHKTTALIRPRLNTSCQSKKKFEELLEYRFT